MPKSVDPKLIADLEHADQMRAELNDLDAEIYLFELEKPLMTPQAARIVGVLRKLFVRIEYSEKN